MQASWRRASGEGAKGRTRVPLARRFTYRYVLAIALFVAIAVAWKVTSDDASERIRDLTQQMDKAAAQPTRLDHLVELASKVTFQTDTSDRQEINNAASELQQEATQFEKTQEGLINGDLQLNLPKTALSPELEQLYNGDPERLREQVVTIANSATTIASLKDFSSANETGREGEHASIISLRDETVKGLQRATSLYSQQIQREVASLETSTTTLLVTSLLVAFGTFAFLFRPMARSIHLETSQLEQAERNHRANNERQTFRNELSQALEVTDAESEVLAAVGRAMRAVIPENPAELLLGDTSGAHLRAAEANPSTGPAGCPVDSPMGCAAIRRGQTVVYESSRMLNVCPKLPQHGGGACSAVCVPVMFMGSALGVLHAVGPDGQPPTHTEIERLSVLASETGNRLGILRNTKSTELRATTDGLTGLANRRAIEDKARTLLLDDEPFSVAMADLDHFKNLNDQHGHEAGDRALRLFAEVLEDKLRPDDVAARYGGEEFVIILPGTKISEAVPVIERLMAALDETLRTSGSIPFTASWGLTDTSIGTTFDEVVAAADVALYNAKRSGRNCLMVDIEAANAAGMAISPDQIVEPDELARPARRDDDTALASLDAMLSADASDSRPSPPRR